MITEIKQGKKGKRKKYQYQDVIYDSKNEIYFVWWLNEAIERGDVVRYKYQEGPYFLSGSVKYNFVKELKTKSKIVERQLLPGHSYTPDFTVSWNLDKPPFFYKALPSDCDLSDAIFIAQEVLAVPKISIVDIKGKFQTHQSQKFALNQKWMYQQYGIYVNKIVPQELFKKTFIPERYRLTDKKTRRRKINL